MGLPYRGHHRPPQRMSGGTVALITITAVIGALAVLGGLVTLLDGGKKPVAKPVVTETTEEAVEDKPKIEVDAKSGVDQPGQWACDDFASGYRSAQTRSARVELANEVNEWAPKSKSGRIADMGVILGRGADGSASAWQIGADAFAQACFDAGWKH